MIAKTAGRRARAFHAQAVRRIAQLLAAGLAAVSIHLLVPYPEARAEGIRWNSPECSYSIEFPGQPDVRTTQYPRRPGGAPGPEGPAQTDLVMADYATGEGGSLSAGCAIVDKPLSRGALQAMVYSASSALTPVRLDNGPCLDFDVTVECARMEAVLLQQGVAVMRSVVTMRSDGHSVFFTRVQTPFGAPGAELSDVEETFSASLEFVGVD